ncbi:hypothetical protein GCM10011613_04670 [Cellvibrio zantedeschiae]|uniref:Tetratricopeptide repeat protein n=2 Tax=Cellvibrio zantedeschiae TaxID=1237077 RepID=A0ABQ3APQ2_9GAMM|nr:hypothetical protein GCM10011613_04670 [Cellvibrio zantedeschiae]
MIKSAAFLFSIFLFPSITFAQILDGGQSNNGGEVGPNGAKTYSNDVGFDGASSKDALYRFNRDVNDKLQQSRPKFARAFERTQDALIKGDMQKADKSIAELRDIKPANDYERARLHLINYWYYGKTGNQELEFDSASKLMAVGAGNIDPNAYVEAGMRLLKRQYNRQDIGGAIETLANLRKVPESSTELMTVVQAVKKLDDIAEEKTDFVQKINVNESGVWSAKLFKPRFFFNGVSGEINTLGFDCTNKQTTLPYKLDSVMEIPEAWGSCTMKVNAKPNTSFNLVQQKPV